MVRQDKVKPEKAYGDIRGALDWIILDQSDGIERKISQSAVVTLRRLTTFTENFTFVVLRVTNEATIPFFVRKLC